MIFDNFETQLERVNDGFRIADEQARRFLAALVKTTSQGTKFLFTSRFVFDLDERLGDVANIPLGDLSRPEAFSVMLKLPRLAKAGYAEKGTIYDTFGGHPFALVALDKYCQTSSVEKALQNAKAVHTKLREHLALELNYGRLTEPARELLNRLAAFRVAVPMEAAEWVMGEMVTPPLEELQPMIAMLRQDEALQEELKDADDTTLLQMLTAALPAQRQVPNNLQQSVRELIEWGLLTPVYKSDELSHLDVHNLVRDFCREKKADTWRNRLREAAGFYTNLTSQFPKEQKTPVVVWGEMEAFELLIEAEDYRDAAILLMGAHELLNRWGFGRYVESQYARVLDRVERAVAAVLLSNFGELQQNRGNYEAAVDYYQRSLKITEELGDMEGVATSHAQMGTLYQVRGSYDKALDSYQRALKIFEEMGSNMSQADTLHNIGNVHYRRGNYEVALDNYQHSLKIREELDDVAGIAKSLHQIGMVQEENENYETALDYYQRSLKIMEELGDVAGVAASLHQIGNMQYLRGNYEVALDYYQRSLKILEELDDVAGIAKSLHQIGMVQQEHGNYEASLDYYLRSLKIAEELGNVAGVADAQAQIGMLLTEIGHHAEAFRLLLNALSIFLQLESPNAQIAVNNLHTLRGKWGGFDAAWREAKGDEVPEWMRDEG